MLTSTGVAGRPREHLWYRFDAVQLQREWSRFDAADPFGTKLTFAELVRIWELLSAADRAACRIVWMRRRDRLAQAVSRYRAQESNCWNFRSGQSVPRAHRMVRFNAERILAHHRDLETQDRQLNHWLDSHDIPFLQVCYEDLVDDAEGIARCVLRFLQLPADVPLRTECYVRLADDISQEWMDRLRALQPID